MEQYREHVKTAFQAALDLATKGIPCFPCNNNKKPVCQHGFNDATSNPDTLTDLWRRFPGVLIGIPTGEIIGIDVLDVDPQNGGDKWWGSVYQSIPPTQTHRTPTPRCH